MSDWSSFKDAKEHSDAWKKYLNERDTGKYNFDQTVKTEPGIAAPKKSAPSNRILLSNALIGLEKDGLASGDQIGQIHDLIRKAIVAKHGRQQFDKMVGEASTPFSMSFPTAGYRAPATTRRRLDSIDLTSVGIAAANQGEVAKRLNNLLSALNMEVIVADAAAAVADEPAINKLPKLKPAADAIQSLAYDKILSPKEASQLLSNVLTTLNKKGYQLDKMFEDMQLEESFRDRLKSIFKGVAPVSAPRTAKSTAGVKRAGAEESVITQQVASQDVDLLRKAQKKINNLLSPFDIMIKLVSAKLPKGGKAPGIDSMLRSPDDIAPALEESFKRMSKLAGIIRD
jgi:hypothetical protein